VSYYGHNPETLDALLRTLTAPQFTVVRELSVGFRLSYGPDEPGSYRWEDHILHRPQPRTVDVLLKLGLVDFDPPAYVHKRGRIVLTQTGRAVMNRFRRRYAR
jgi:hypothetical protein